MGQILLCRDGREGCFGQGNEQKQDLKAGEYLGGTKGDLCLASPEPKYSHEYKREEGIFNGDENGMSVFYHPGPPCSNGNPLPKLLSTQKQWNPQQMGPAEGAHCPLLPPYPP